MLKSRQPFFILILLGLCLQLFTYFSYADVGTAAWYAPPYLRKYISTPSGFSLPIKIDKQIKIYMYIYTATACYGNDQSQFPSSNLFGAAGEGIWDNGASCGRQYLVRCISAAEPNTCLPGLTIQIKIVDYALQSVSPPSRSGTTIVLSQAAFAAITNSSSTATSINIEFQQ